jgi:beta-mannanase
MEEGIFEVFIFSLNPYLRDHTNDSDTINGPTATEWKISNGDYDAWINTLAQQCKDFAYVIMLKIGPEMNGNQGPHGPGSWIADFGATPAAFTAAWKRIVDIFRATGVTNVAWCITFNFESVGVYDFEDYYPGNDYVDWIGVDYYQMTASDDPSSQVGAFYSWSASKNRPLTVAEWGTNWYNKNIPDSDRARYINAFFDDIETRPKFKMIRCHWYSWWRFQDDNPLDYGYMPLASAVYRNRIANDRYLAHAP